MELRGSNHAIKTVMRWTGASERTVKSWLSGTSGPSGEHLIALLQNSDTLLERVLKLAGRSSLIEGRRLEDLKDTMAQAVATIEALLSETLAARLRLTPDKCRSPSRATALLRLRYPQ